MKKRVLIIDDSPSILVTLESIIKSSIDNIEIVTVKTLKECEDTLFLKDQKFDIIISDLDLPDASNGQIIDYIKIYELPIIVLSGTSKIDYELIHKNPFIVDYVIKDSISALHYVSSIVKRILNNKDIKVLIIDDSETFVLNLKSLLCKYNLQVFTAYDGLEALEIIEKNSDIKLVVTDYLMPKLDGLEFTKEIRKYYPKDEMSIIVTSNIKDRMIASKFLKYGANDFIFKGFTVEELFTRINSNLETIELFQELKNMANIDYLTKLFNRRYLFTKGKEFYEEIVKNKKSLACSIIDIDNFKLINDTYGHDVGDLVIKELAFIMKNNFVKNSIVSRMGGEEFCILNLVSSQNELENILEELRKDVASSVVKFDNNELNFTISLGTTTNIKDSFDEMLQLADMALYKAKNNGKNRIEYL